VTDHTEAGTPVGGNPDNFRDWDAAYVLGALSADDRRAYERHLQTCPACSTAVAELAGMPGLLAKLPAEKAVSLLSLPAEQSAPEQRVSDDQHLRDERHEPGLVRRLSIAANKRQRRMRGLLVGLAAGAAAVLLVGGVLIGSAISPAADQALSPSSSSPGTPSADVLAMAPVGTPVMTADLQLTEKGWGTRFDWSCSYLDAWSSTASPSQSAPAYSLVVTDDAGEETTVATWSAAGPEASNLVASSSVRTDDIREVEIRWAGTTKALVRAEL
jgi:hypothetical protein